MWARMVISTTVSEVFRWEDVGPRARHAGGDGDGNDDCDVGGTVDTLIKFTIKLVRVSSKTQQVLAKLSNTRARAC